MELNKLVNFTFKNLPNWIVVLWTVNFTIFASKIYCLFLSVHAKDQQTKTLKF